MSNNTKKNISTLLVISALINAAIIVVYISFVFRADGNLFTLDKANIEKRISIYIDSLSDKLDYYDSRISKIIESYRFIDFINTSTAEGVDEEEVKKIVSLFRDGENPFSSVALYNKEGQSIFSAPVRITFINTNKMSLLNSFYSSYNEAYDGIEFTSSIKDNQGYIIGYIVASVDKSVFNKIVQNSSILFLTNAVIYYNNDININNVPKEYLASLLNNIVEFEPYFQNVKDSSLLFYSSKLSNVQNLSIGFLLSDTNLLHKYLKYIILAVLCLSLIFLVASVFFEVFRRSVYSDESSLNKIMEQDNIIDEEMYTKDINEIENIQNDITIEDITVDDIEDTIVSQYSITETTGSILDEEISKQEEEYFSSKEAFDVHYDGNFLNDEDKPESTPDIVSSFLSEEIDTEDLFKNLDLDKDLEIISESGLLDDKVEEPIIEEGALLVDNDLDEVPKIPDDYYSDEARKDANSDDISSEKKWSNIINSLKGKKFVNKNMNEMIEWIKDNANINPDSALMLEYNLDTKSYIGVDNYNLSYETQTLFTIDREEPLFVNILSNHKPLSIVNPFESVSIATKVNNEDKSSINKILFIPIEDKTGAIKSFFVLNSKE